MRGSGPAGLHTQDTSHTACRSEKGRETVWKWGKCGVKVVGRMGQEEQCEGWDLEKRDKSVKKRSWVINVWVRKESKVDRKWGENGKCTKTGNAEVLRKWAWDVLKKSGTREEGQRHIVCLENEQIDGHFDLKRAHWAILQSRLSVHPLPLLLLSFQTKTPEARINITVSAGRKVKGQYSPHNLLQWPCRFVHYCISTEGQRGF